MNLRAQISDELWERVRSSYEAEHYTHALRDAMVFVTEVLRDKSGLDGDGRGLVNSALGFGKDNKPKIQVNKLETETEKDIQNGLREVLSGMYALVRNPRTHEHLNDDKKTADAIICFIDYLLNYIGKSKPAYTVENFIARVSDQYFVQDKSYVQTLAASIPIRKRVDTMVALIREATWKQAENFKLILDELLNEATDIEIDSLLNVVSRRLEEATEGADVSLVRKLIPADYWPKLDILARLRAENILIEELKSAWFTPDTRAANSSARTASWLLGIIPYMSLRKQLRAALLDLLRRDDDYDYNNYVAEHFFTKLPELFKTEGEIFVCAMAVADSIRRGNEFVERKLRYNVQRFPETWFVALANALKHLTDPEAPKWHLPDGTPVLTRSGDEEEEEEDDIPF